MQFLFPIRLALRYLMPHRTFLSVITVISIAGVVVACMGLTLVIPIMSGFEASVKKRLLGSQPHAIFKQAKTPLEGGFPIAHWEDTLEQIQTFPEVESAFPVVEGFVFLEHGTLRSPQPMFAVEPTNSALIEELQNQLEDGMGSADLSQLPKDSSLDGVCLINSVTATVQEIKVGQNITLYSPSSLEELVYRIEELERSTLSERAGETLLDLHDRLVAAVQAASPQPPPATAPAADLPLSQAQAISIPIELVRDLEETLQSLSDNYRNTNSSPSTRELLNREFEEEALMEAIEALNQFSWVDETQQRLVYPATNRTSPLGDIRDILLDLGSPPTKSEQNESIQQLRNVILPKTLEVIGIYHGIGTSASVIVPLHIGQELYSLHGSVHSIGVHIDDPYRFSTPELTQQWIAQAHQQLGPQWTVESWYDRYGTLFGQIANERKIMYIILFILMLLASFCICSNLVTTTILKRREVGLLKAFGAKGWQISGIFLFQGFVVGLIGTVFGLGLGLLLLQLRNHIKQLIFDLTGQDIFPASVYGLDGGIPAIITPSHLAIVCLGAFTFSCLAALPPAWLISRVQPAPALRSQGS